MLEALQQVYWPEILQGTWDTILMTLLPLFFTVVLGLPLGILLFITSKDKPLAQPRFYAVTALIVNLLRSMPFIILLIILIPLSRAIAGTSLGVRGAIVPLTIAATPFFARLVENVLRELDRGILEACQSMGIRLPHIIVGALLPEALPGILAAITVTGVTLISYTAMAGAVGAGGLGDIAIRYGYQRFETTVLIVSVVFLVILVNIMEWAGQRLVRHFTHW